MMSDMSNPEDLQSQVSAGSNGLKRLGYKERLNNAEEEAQNAERSALKLEGELKDLERKRRWELVRGIIGTLAGVLGGLVLKEAMIYFGTDLGVTNQLRLALVPAGIFASRYLWQYGRMIPKRRWLRKNVVNEAVYGSEVNRLKKQVFIENRVLNGEPTGGGKKWN